MKKYLVGILLASMLVVVPFVSSAVTISELDAKISRLEVQISQIQDQISKLLGGSTDPNSWSARIDSIDFSASSRKILVPGGWVKLRGMRLTDKVTIVGTNYPPLQVKVSDSDRRVDFKLDPRMAIGSYEAYVTGANGKISNKIALNLTGEPVVDLVEPAPGATVAPGSWIKLRGQRLTTNVNWFHPSVCSVGGDGACAPGPKANQYPVLEAKLSDNNTRLDFKVDPRELPGQYEIEIINSWGQSNRFPFTIVSGDGTIPAPEVAPRISAISGGQYPGGWVKLSGMRLTTDVRITRADGTGANVYVPLQIKDTNGDGTRIDFKLDPAMPVASNYYINVYSKTGMKSQTLRFPVSAKPATSASVSQIANILSSLSAVLGQMKDE